ncbi:MAG TPA: L,D-transpeptidase family protein [Pyrinomonadaceae bacterium]|nr:L,D-transpeptidase family protein [Pyrinomonadaceae bacterium]
MKSLITTYLLLVSLSSFAYAQQSTSVVTKVLTRAHIKEAELRLSDRGYWTGPVDGRFDPATRSALIAFQKWEGRLVTERLTLDELEAIRTSTSPKARELGYSHVEVDLDRQVLIIVNPDGRVRILPVSTGNGKPFIEDGQESLAYTPRGRFLVYDRSVGWEQGALGSVYYANYISGGVAIHGHPNVPTKPASHGCIRIPMFAAREVSKLMKLGTIVLVYDQVSFVSAKVWVENPELKEAAMSNGATRDYRYQRLKKGSSSIVIKKPRPKSSERTHGPIFLSADYTDSTEPIKGVCGSR